MNIYRKRIERITITGKMPDETGKAFDYCRDNGFCVVRSGPKPIAKYRVSLTVFKIVAEREISND